jgi:hypothetical protein
MIPRLKLVARFVLPVVSLGAGLSGLDSAGSNTAPVAAAIVALVAAYWWHASGPQPPQA